jgi:phosphohistidine phosphatase
MKTKPDYWYKQSAVIPFRFSVDKPEILIVTTRKKKKWTIPKGIVEIGLSDKKSAEKEALEEAGVKGNLLRKKAGNFSYEKWGGICQVNVYALEVETVLDDWQENFRERKWIEVRDLEKFITNKSLLKIIEKFSVEVYKEFSQCSL